MHPESDPSGKTTEQTLQDHHSTLVSRNVTIAGHRTSVRLEPEMWSGLNEICRRERASIREICTSVATRKNVNTSLTAAIRVFVMAYFRTAATEDGHVKAGHGYTGNSIGTAFTSTPATRNAMQSTPSANTGYMMATSKYGGGRY